MARPVSQRRQQLPHVQARIEADLYDLLLQYAEANEMNIGEAVRACIDAHLSEKRGMRERGYKDGILRAAHTVKKSAGGALKGLFGG